MAKQNFVGLVVSQGKMSKTVKVRVQRKVYDSRIHKELIKRKDYLVHDEGEICKEGDIVRIESIPKISSRKAFAIAEIKVNKGQQFALYEELAKKRVIEIEQQKGVETEQNKSNLLETISRIEALRKLDDVAIAYQASNVSETEREKLLKEINDIKDKYKIKSWPSTQEILPLDINKEEIQLNEIEHRRKFMTYILDKFYEPEMSQKREEILSQLSTKPLKKNIAKNLLRKYVLKPENEIPFPY
ncbi:uncharacterized protein RJT21DRAFT_35800 [Scheffersomyces amazonensis]|uniref:uncharacterized protein n=1 Tax=Scheffersomyces amazonensis TaxID=1078765 RepID=UPI00315CF8B1